MPTRAYVLITAAAGQAAAVAEALRALPGVAQADVVTGPYDVVAVVEAADVAALGRLVLNQLHGIPALANTLTLIAVA
jgi:DNA-binding Lrp family transcriptional regulator